MRATHMVWLFLFIECSKKMPTITLEVELTKGINTKLTMIKKRSRSKPQLALSLVHRVLHRVVVNSLGQDFFLLFHGHWRDASFKLRNIFPFFTTKKNLPKKIEFFFLNFIFILRFYFTFLFCYFLIKMIILYPFLQRNKLYV